MGIAVAASSPIAAILPTTDDTLQAGANVDIGVRSASPDYKIGELKTKVTQPKMPNRESVELTPTIQSGLATIAEEGDHLENRSNEMNLYSKLNLNPEISQNFNAKLPADMKAEISINSPQIQNITDRNHLPDTNMEGNAYDRLDTRLIVNDTSPKIDADGFDNKNITDQVDASLPAKPTLNIGYDHPSAPGRGSNEGTIIENIAPITTGNVENSPVNLEIDLAGNMSVPSIPIRNDNTNNFHLPNQIKKPKRTRLNPIRIDNEYSASPQAQELEVTISNRSVPQQFTLPTDGVDVEGIAPKSTTKPVIVTPKNVGSPSSHTSDLENISVNLSWDGSIINDNIPIAADVASISADCNSGINADNESELPVGANISPLTNDDTEILDHTKVNNNENNKLANMKYPVS